MPIMKHHGMACQFYISAMLLYIGHAAFLPQHVNLRQRLCGVALQVAQRL
jgi:hypothetical protein